MRRLSAQCGVDQHGTVYDGAVHHEAFRKRQKRQARQPPRAGAQQD
eukprot:gene2811-59060_t